MQDSISALTYLDAMGIKPFARPGVEIEVEDVDAAIAVELEASARTIESASTEPVMASAIEPVPQQIEEAAFQPEVVQEQVKPDLVLDCRRFTLIRLGDRLLVTATANVAGVFSTTEAERSAFSAIANALKSVPEIDFMPPLSGLQSQYFETDQQVFEGLQHYIEVLQHNGVVRQVVLIGPELSQCASLLSLSHVSVEFPFKESSSKRLLWQALHS